MTVDARAQERRRESAQLLLNALWHQVRLELRRSGFCVFGSLLVQALLNEATGEVCNLPELRLGATTEARATATLDRKKKLVVFRRLFEIGDPDDFMRASGEVICETCGYQLFDHPELKGRAKGLRMTCDGKKVKL